MKKIEPWKTWTFIGLLLVIALLVNSMHDQVSRHRSERIPSSSYYQEPETSPSVVSQPIPERTPEPRREVQLVPQNQTIPPKSPEELAAERARFRARYIKDGVSRASGKTTVLVAVADANGKPRPALATLLATHVASDSVHALPSAFTSSYATDGLLAEAFRDSASVVAKLDLEKVADVLLLAREKTEFVRNDSSLANVLTANTELEVLAVPTTKRGENQTWMFSSKGAGFSQTDALAAAEERIMNQITNGNTIVLP